MVRDRSQSVELMQLFPKIRRCLEQPPFSADRVDDGKTDHSPSEFMIGPSRVLLGAGLRRATILGNTQHDQVWVSICLIGIFGC